MEGRSVLLEKRQQKRVLWERSVILLDPHRPLILRVQGLPILQNLEASHLHDEYPFGGRIVKTETSFGEACKPLRSPFQGEAGVGVNVGQGEIVQPEHVGMVSGDQVEPEQLALRTQRPELPPGLPRPEGRGYFCVIAHDHSRNKKPPQRNRAGFLGGIGCSQKGLQTQLYVRRNLPVA